MRPERLPRRLAGPLPVLPRPVDALADRWAGLAPRVRLVVVVAALALLGVGVSVRVQLVDARWGGAPVRVLVAEDDLLVGAHPTAVRAVAMPPGVVPPGALDAVPDGARLAYALPAGSILTAHHLDAAGPGAGLRDDLRALPVEVEEGWGVEAGGWVDVWVLGDVGTAAEQVAASRPVLAVSVDDLAGATALIGLAPDEVGAATRGLAAGRLLLAHAPPPGPPRRPP